MLRSPRKRGCFSRVRRGAGLHGPIPAQAGVFPHRAICIGMVAADPRASGGVSLIRPSSPPSDRRSPRKRGCFQPNALLADAGEPIPAQAGVFLGAQWSEVDFDTDPRASGGVSPWRHDRKGTQARSPRKRGCFHLHGEDRQPTRPIPAQAGVFRRIRPPGPYRPTDPRASGGVSDDHQPHDAHHGRSPRKRGCFRRRAPRGARSGPIPAQAGVFPCNARELHAFLADPRASGGVSRERAAEISQRDRSPRKRGCFFVAVAHDAARAPIPAQAGVFRPHVPAPDCASSDPRASGGVSNSDSAIIVIMHRSPRKRGCFRAPAREQGRF